jgi:hypothetical protein
VSRSAAPDESRSIRRNQGVAQALADAAEREQAVVGSTPSANQRIMIGMR